MARAAEFFRDNFQLFGNLEEKEKYNLYGGLIELAKDIEDIEYKLNNIEARLSSIENRIS